MTALSRHFQHCTIGLHIEGIPYLEAKRTGGVVWTFGDEPTWESDAGFYPHLEWLPAQLSGSVDPWTGELELSALQVGISATEQAVRLLMHYPRALVRVGTDDGAGGFEGDVAAGETSIVVTSGQTISVGDYLWIGNECLYVDSAAADGEEWTLGVTRGISASPDEAHAAGAFVYQECPLAQLEPIGTLYLYDHAEESTTILWRGLLDADVETDDDQNTIIVRSSEMLQRLVDLELARVRPRFESANLVVKGGPDGVASGSVLGTVRPVDPASIDWVNPSQTTKILRVGDDYIGPFSWNATDAELTPTGGWIFGARIPVDADVNAPVPGEIREVLAVNRLQSNEYGGIAHNSFSGITGGLNFAAVALSILLSTGEGTNDPAFGTFDILGRPWGVGFPVSLIDEASWQDVIDEDAGQIDQLLLGYDGAFDAWDTIRDLVVGNSCFLAITNEGTLAIRRFVALTPRDLGEVMTARHWTVLEPQRIKLQRGGVRPNVSAELGKIDAPGFEGASVRVSPVRGTRRDSTTYNEAPDVYSMPWRYATEAGLDQTRHFLDTQATRRAENLPTIRVMVPYRHFSQQLQAGNYSARILPSLGQWLRLRAPTDASDGSSELEVIGPEGRLDINATAILFLGRYVGFDIDLASGGVEATVLLENWMSGDAFPRLVAPSHRIVSYDPATRWAVLATTWLSNDDASELVAGDQVELVIESGKIWLGDPGELTVDDVDDVGPQYRVQLSDNPAVLPDGYDVFVRLVDVDEYSNDGWAGSEWFAGDQASRLWAFIAGTDLELGTVLQADPDVYAG